MHICPCVCHCVCVCVCVRVRVCVLIYIAIAHAASCELTFAYPYAHQRQGDTRNSGNDDNTSNSSDHCGKHYGRLVCRTNCICKEEKIEGQLH